MNYEVEVEKNEKINEKYLDEFENWLKDKGLAKKTIRNHIENASLYINDFLVYYEVIPMEEGIYHIDSFLSDWFVRKCMWSTGYSVKRTAASIKKFYECMSDLGYIKQEEYKELCNELKENMDYYVDNVEEYNNFDEDDYW